MSDPSIDHVRSLVASHASSLSADDRYLIARHLAEVERLLLVCVGIVRRAAERGAPVAPSRPQALEVGGHVRVAAERGGR